ncbi:hypothetical protein FisN_15Hh275 [Fistulifera solaris]|uniref:Hexose transporter 1 n=1 Tax=Fistulifera solaris TaxID=1519565 RepID=A0A1Z5JFU2_FISSO|nr:hypothetical protein FisN_15Hh275 [Fistulifera solaris]|eukprot:GAX12796.1 hypothetical protein FisN_15Hh275 [Fistulifera solaris]
MHDNKEEESHVEKTFPVTRATYAYALGAALNSCNLGYDIGVSTNAGPLIATDFQLTSLQLELFLGSLNFWTIFGALSSPCMTDRYGRTTTFVMAAMGFLVGIAVMIVSSSFESLMVGRMIVGVAVGVGEAVDPMYIAEISPKHVRGRLVSWAEAGVALGVVLGFSSSLVFYAVENVATKWRCMVGAGMILPIIMVLMVAFGFLPESPQWLISQNQESAARVVLERIYPSDAIDDVVDDIQSSIELERQSSNAVGWNAIFAPSPAVKRMLMVGIGMATIQQAVGIDAVMFYLMFVIKGSGIATELGEVAALMVLGLVKLVFVFVGANLFDRVGRRPLLFVSLCGMAAALSIVSITFLFQSRVSEACTVLGLALYLAFFSIGVGPGNWVVVSEIFATSIRAKGMCVAVLPNRIMATLMASSFLSLAQWLTWPGFFFVLAIICLASAWFLWSYLPETKDKSLEEMSMYFAALTGDRSILDTEDRLHHGQPPCDESSVELPGWHEENRPVMT